MVTIATIFYVAQIANIGILVLEEVNNNDEVARNKFGEHLTAHAVLAALFSYIAYQAQLRVQITQ
jgi:hypothetical protein